MNKRILFLNLCLLLTMCGPAFAATNYVILGGDFQATIDASAPGDTLVVQAGVYLDNLSFYKPVTVLRSGTNQMIEFRGSVQITGTGAVSFAQSQFSSSLPIQCTGTVSFSQCLFRGAVTSQAATILLSQVTCSNTFTANLFTGSGTNLQAYDSIFQDAGGNSLNVTGGKVLLKRCTLWGLTLTNNAALEALRMTNNSVTTATASVGTGTPFVAVQSAFNSLSLTGYKVWLGYNSIVGGTVTVAGTALVQINCDAVLVGNYIFGGSMGIRSQGGTLKAYNNLITITFISTAYGMYLSSSVAEIVNNTILVNALNTYASRGILVDSGGPITIRGNIINASGEVSSRCIDSTGQTLIVSYCDFYPYGNNNVINDPVVNCLFVNPNLTGNDVLSPGSPCIGTGPPEAIYNNRGTTNRNDMGYTGGPLWNPANYTNNNPMVFFSILSPQTVLKGGRTNIQVNAAASAGH